MTPDDARLAAQTRRHFFSRCGVGLGAVALGSLLNEGRAGAGAADPRLANPLALRPGHFPAKAKNVIYLFMARGPRGGAVNWGSGFLPSAHQGVPFRNGAEPILNLSTPPGVDPASQSDALAAIRDLDRERLDATGDPEIATRIASYEMAFRMQT